MIYANVDFPVEALDTRINYECEISHNSGIELTVEFIDPDQTVCRVFESDLPLLNRLMKERVPHADKLYAAFMKYYLAKERL